MRVLLIALSVLATAFFILVAAFNLFAVPDAFAHGAGEPEDLFLLILFATVSLLWAATAAVNGAVLGDLFARNRVTHVLNLASLSLIALVAASMIYAGTATAAENTLLAIPALVIALGYWRIVKDKSAA
jgi:hypothetical protein